MKNEKTKKTKKTKKRWEKAGERKARMYIPAIGALLGAPAFFLVIIIPSFYASMFFLFVE